MQPAGPMSDDLRTLAMRFESLCGAGRGCEFGLFQRELGAESPGLLRWADLSAEFVIAGSLHAICQEAVRLREAGA